MIPYRDENETQRRPIVTATIIGLNIFTWLVVQGAGADFPLAKSVCELGLIPGELTGSLPVGSRFPDGAGASLPHRPGPAAISPYHFDVFAWLVDASLGQHVVPLAVWQ